MSTDSLFTPTAVTCPKCHSNMDRLYKMLICKCGHYETKIPAKVNETITIYLTPTND